MAAMDRTGMRYGMLVAIKRVPTPANVKDKRPYWLCRCDCGNQIVLPSSSLKNNVNSKNHGTWSCGCVKRGQKSVLDSVILGDDEVINMHNNGATSLQIAAKFGVTASCVNKHLRKYGIHQGKGHAQPRVEVCEECGKEYTTDNSNFNTRYCSNKCCNRAASRKHQYRRRIEKYGTGARADNITIGNLIKRDGKTCYLCGCETDESDFMINESGYFIAGEHYPSIDHVVPLSKGGTHTLDNVRVACRHCNSIKGDREVAYAIGYCREKRRQTQDVGGVA